MHLSWALYSNASLPEESQKNTVSHHCAREGRRNRTWSWDTILSRCVVSSILVNGVFMHRPVCGSIYYYKTVSAVWKEPTHRQVIDNTIKFLLMRRKRNASVVVKNLTSFPCFDALLISSDSLRSSLQIYAAYCGWGKTEVGKVFGIVSY